VALTNASGARTLTVTDQESAGGGRCNSGGKVWGAGGGIARATLSTRFLRTTPAGAPGFAAEKVEWIVETAFDAPAALKAGGAGSHRAEKPVAAPGPLRARACANAKPSATTSAKPNAKRAHLRTMEGFYTRMPAHVNARRKLRRIAT
jgi:hypothetical protein